MNDFPFIFARSKCVINEKNNENEILQYQYVWWYSLATIILNRSTERSENIFFFVFNT